MREKILTLSRYKSPTPIDKKTAPRSILHLYLFAHPFFSQRKFLTVNNPCYPFAPTLSRKIYPNISIKNDDGITRSRPILVNSQIWSTGWPRNPSTYRRKNRQLQLLVNFFSKREARAFASPWNGTRSRTRARTTFLRTYRSSTRLNDPV